MTNTQHKIIQICDNLKEFLLEKNRRYGDSALSPVDVFLHHAEKETDPAVKNILLRMNDKINRIINSDSLRDNDLGDLVGYIILIFCQKNVDLKKFLD